MPETLSSFCVICDSPTDCGCGAARYLEPIVYEAVGGGFRAPAHERERWEAGPAIQTALANHAPPKPASEPKPFERLVVELEAWVDLHLELQLLLTTAYERDPGRVTRLVATVCEGAEARRLRSPAGLLVVRLREIAGQAHVT